MLQQFCSVSLESPFKRFAPLLEEIRSKHINSIHQLPQDSFQFGMKERLSKTTQMFAKSQQNASIAQAENTQRDLEKTSTLKNRLKMRIKKASLSPPLDSLSDYRVILINPASKIKSHLIKAIDFDQVEKALYVRPKQKDRFTAFCQRIESRARGTKGESKGENKGEDTLPRQWNLSQPMMKVHDLAKETVIAPGRQEQETKVYIRKKFWFRGKTQQCSRPNNSPLQVSPNKTFFNNTKPYQTAR